MRVLVLGGTGFVGSWSVGRLIEAGHEVILFHRGTHAPPPGTQAITGDRHCLDAHRQPLRALQPDVVLDLICASGRQAASLMRVFRGAAGRVVVASSMDVYRAAAILHRRQPGPEDPTPLSETSPIRSIEAIYPAEQLQRLIAVFPWIDERYDKVAVERVVGGDPELPATILRLPMIYGPGDRLHRLRPLLTRMDDGRPAILLPESLARWRAPRGYVENVATAFVLAAERDEAARRIYNVADPIAVTELEWGRLVAREADWPGRFVVLPDGSVPPHLQVHSNMAQHWNADSRLIRAELGYVEEVSRDEAIRRTIEWERQTPVLAQDFEGVDYEAEDAALNGVGRGFAAGSSPATKM